MKPLPRFPLRAIIAAGIGLILVIAGVIAGPLLLNAPQVVRSEPVDGAEAVNPQAPLRIEFSQLVRRDSLIAALRLEPPVDVQVDVQGNVALVQPVGGLQYGAEYMLTIDAGVRNALGRTSEDAWTVRFRTAPYIAVRDVAPADGAVDIPLETLITVEFSAPVVSAEAVAASADDPRRAADLPQPLTLTIGNGATAVPGIGRWLSPTRFGFFPEDGMRAATTYRVTVRPDLTPDGAARMERPFEWSFTTAAPLLVDTRPFDSEFDVAADRPIEIRLHRDVDRSSASAGFRLFDAGGVAVAGTVETFDDGIRFKPAAPLQRGVRYRAVIEPGVSAISGAVLNTKPFEWSFIVIGDLEVQQVEPAGDTRDVPIDIPRISVRFNHPVVPLVDVAATGGLPVAATVDPPVQGVARWIDTSTFVISPTVPLDPSTDYRVRVAAGLTDQTGGVLRNEYVWSFRTIDPMVEEVLPQTDFASPTEPITITFNQEMDLMSLRSALRVVRSDGALVVGATTISGTSVIVRPDAPLERGASYTIIVDAGARSARGNGVLAETFSSSFRVAPLPALVTTRPAPGDVVSPDYGGLTLIFSTPMDWTTVSQNLVIEPALTNVYTSEYETEFTIYAQFEPDTEYRVTIGSAARDLYGVALGRDVTATFRVGPRESSLSLIGPYRAGFYRAIDTVRVPIQWVNVPEVGWRIARVTPEQAAQLMLSYDYWRDFVPADSTIVTRGTQSLTGERNQGRVGTIEVGALAPGLYYLELRASGKLVDRQVMVVSPYALTVKRSADRLFVWAVDLVTGKPIAGLPVSAAAYRYETGLGASINLGRTNADGVVEAPFDTRDVWTTFVWSADGNGVQTFTTTDWSSGIDPWSFGLSADYQPQTFAGSLLTDKPIYRPGQTMRLRGALRGIAVGAGQGQAERYVLPGADDRAYLLVSDPEGNTIFSTTLRFSAFGTFNIDLPLAQGAPLGFYSMVARLGSMQGIDETVPAVFGSFQVTEYRVPAFEVTVTPATTDLLRGDPLNVNVQAAYFAGGAPAGAPVRWRILAQPFWFASDAAPNFSFADFDDAYAWYTAGEPSFFSGGLIAEGEGVTDAQGRFTLTLPASAYDRLLQAQAPRTGSQTLTIDVEVTDVDGQAIAAQGVVTVHAGAFYVGLRPEGYVASAGQPQQISIITLTPQGDPAPNRSLDVEVYEREWYSVREQGADGRFYWTSAYTDTLIETLPAVTDGQGRGQAQFTPPQGGLYRVVAQGKDDTGRVVQTSAYTWASGGTVFWGVDDSNRVDLIADKRRYRPGDTATILVTAPYPDTTALLTIERGSVIEHRVLTIQGSTGVLQVPIREEYAPNVYVSLTLIKAPGDGNSVDAPATPDLRVGIVKLPVSTERQELTLTLTPDTTQAGPRDTVTYTVKATDSTGKGVRTEVALALVDKAVLTLVDDPNPLLFQAFYNQRALGVFTSNPLTALVDRVTLRLQPGDKGGSGGDLAVGTFVRRDFLDTAFWNPALVTDDNGMAQFSVILPDNLTTWRLIARAITADTLVGEATVDIVASKPLLLRPTLPRALTVGDRPVVQVVVQNTTGAAINATVRITPNPALTIEAPTEQQVTVPANGTALVRWQATVNEPPGESDEALLTVRAVGGGYQDAIETRVPLRRLTTAEATASADQVIDQVVETIKLPPEKTASARVELDLTPSLVAGIVKGVEQLASVPYFSSEATVSSFLPAVASYRLLQQAGFDDPQLRATLERSVTNGLQRLAALQQLDGGWGWWSGDQSDPYLTAYAVQGLAEARRAGFSVDQAMLDQALTFLSEALNDAQRLNNPNSRVYVLFVLGEAGKPDRGRLVNLYNERNNLTPAGKAYLLMALQTAGSEESRIKTLVAELMGRAVLTASDAHWDAGDGSFWGLESNVTTTGLALRALLRADPQNFLIPNAARWLMGERERDVWRTTYDSAGAVLALAEYASQTDDLQADYRYRATLDGRTLREATVTRDTLRETDRVIIAASELKPDGSQVMLQRQAGAGQSGKGRLYYTLRLRYAEDAATAQALDRGFIVQREYIAVASDTLSPTGQLITQARQGDLVQVRITLRVPTDVRYLTVEDFLPGGLEALDTSLKTTTAAARDAALELQIEDSNAMLAWWYFTHTEVRDGRVVLFATDLPKGVYTYTYLARATVPGTYVALPATAYRTYAPDVFGRSTGASFTIN